MDRRKLEIGHPLAITVRWYDNVREPPQLLVYEDEVIGWRDSQISPRSKSMPSYDFGKRPSWKLAAMCVRSE
jgi:hypothetical protein